MRYVITHPKGIEVVEMESHTDVELYSEAKYGKTMPVKKSRWAWEHPLAKIGLEEEKVILAMGFEDTSWHNDEIPCFQLKLQPMGEDDDVINLWVGDEENSGYRYSVQYKNNPTGEYFGEEHYFKGLFDVKQQVDQMKSEYDQKYFDNAVMLDMIEIMILRYSNSNRYAGSNEELAHSNILYAYAEKCGLWSDDDTDEFSRDHTISRLEILKDRIERL